MVFLRPTIVRSKNDIREISEHRYNSLRDMSQPVSRGSDVKQLPNDPHQMFDGKSQKSGQGRP